MLRQIIAYLNIRIANKDADNFEDFMQNVIANVISNRGV